MRMPRRWTIRSLGIAGFVITFALVATGCSRSESPAEAARDQPFGPCGSSYPELVAKAKEEGRITLMGTPRGSAGTARVIEGFTNEYGIRVATVFEDASSADELTILRTWKGDSRYPDVVDLTPAALEQATSEGLLADYRVQSYDAIADVFKRSNGLQVANYSGLMSFGVNRSKVTNVPHTWAELEKPEYRGAIALNGDPRESGAGIQAIAAAALANGGSYDDVKPGIDFFARLRESGNLRVSEVSNADVLYGDTPIAIDWNYSFPPLARKLAKEGIEFVTVIPSDSIARGVYFQGLVADALHPCAARLWLDYLVSDDVAVTRMRAGAIPARYSATRSRLSSTEQALVPSDADINASLAPTAEQFRRMSELVNDLWVPLVVNAKVGSR
ncbi:MAG: extracellular solute-binding protein [Actinobacteria bacterium]|nr:extracellular solute-binding protein [Actinomycetota bacterium]